MFNFTLALGGSESQILESLKNLWDSTGFAGFNTDTLLNLVMMAIAGLLLFLAISKKFEPNLLLAMAFGMFLINIPGAYNILYGTQGYDFTLNLAAYSPEQITNLIAAGVINSDGYLLLNGNVLSGTLSELAEMLNLTVSNSATVSQQTTAILEKALSMFSVEGIDLTAKAFIDNITINHTTIADFGLFYYLYKGVDWVLFPPLIFLGIGAMTDFGPLIANPKSLLLGAAAQIGIFVTFILASLFGFTGAEAASTGIIGGADGPTAIYLTSKLASHLMSSIAIAAYSYMALVPVIQPQIMKELTTKK